MLSFRVAEFAGELVGFLANLVGHGVIFEAGDLVQPLADLRQPDCQAVASFVIGRTSRNVRSIVAYPMQKFNGESDALRERRIRATLTALTSVRHASRAGSGLRSSPAVLRM